MPRPQGTPKTGGRKKGTPNRRTGELADQFAALGVDVVAEIAQTLPGLDAETRIKILMDLMTFLFPKRKAVEHSVEVGTVAPPQEREKTPEELAEMRTRSLRFTKNFIQLDKDYAMVAIKTLVEMKSALTLPPEGKTLLEANF